MVEHLSPKQVIVGSSPTPPAYGIYILEKQGAGILAKRCARVLRALLLKFFKEKL